MRSPLFHPLISCYSHLHTQFLLHFSEKAPLNKSLKKEPNANVPAELKDKKQAHEEPTIADTQEEADALRTPPDPAVPSGILSVMIHQINNRTSSFLSVRSNGI